MSPETSGVKVLATNRRARFTYQVEDSFECGLALAGTEVKSMRKGKFSFSDAYGRIRDEELWLVGFHISPYDHATIFNHEPDRDRKLLAHKQEIIRLKRKVDERGFTLVPLKVYLKNGLVKIELGICRGKKLVDKRNTIKERDQKRDAEREMRGRM